MKMLLTLLAVCGLMACPGEEACSNSYCVVGLCALDDSGPCPLAYCDGCSLGEVCCAY